jgi:short-subunit dehydrogenase
MTRTPSKFARRYGPWALVTGASSGIGAGFARRLAAEGFNVALAARRSDRLAAVAAEIEARFQVATRCATVDLSVDGAAARLDAMLHDLDLGLVVSNAGTGEPGLFLDQDYQTLRARFHLNAMASLDMAYLFGARLARRGGGGLILGGAFGAMQGVPFSAADAGAKAMVQSLGCSLHVELKPRRVQVMTLIVPPTDTAIIAKFGLDPAEMPMKPMSVEQCVAEALRHFRQARPLSLPGAFNRFVSAVVPAGVLRVMMGQMIGRTLRASRAV